VYGLANTSEYGIFATGNYREGAIPQIAAATEERVLVSYGILEYLK